MIGIFGGAFDPIHFGHLNLAQGVLENLPLTEIQWIPCGRPPHRKPLAVSPDDRFNMVKLAIAGQEEFTVNDIEIKQSGIAYTIDTVKTLQQQLPQQTLCFIIATDAFAKFNLWGNYQNLLNYCHIIVGNRPNYDLPQQATWLDQLLATHQTHNKENLLKQPTGKIFFQQLNTLPFSASDIRHHLNQGDYAAVKDMMPLAVIDYIKQHQLYLHSVHPN